MKAQIFLALFCALVVSGATVIACGGGQPEPTTPGGADGGTVTNGTATTRVPKEGPSHEH